MKKVFTVSCLLVVGFFLLSGCSVRHGDFTVLSNKLVNISDFELSKADRVKGIVGEDIQHIIIFIPIGGPPTLEEALDDAIVKGGGDVMTDAVVEAWGFYIPYIYGQNGWRVSGDVVKNRKN